ncbi:hypothetical protein T296_12890 [Pantoea agglomerans Eh318]|nr:hypothetical protein T296_12890 [Pantoea agglomerans Eh318]
MSMVVGNNDDSSHNHTEKNDNYFTQEHKR